MGFLHSLAIFPNLHSDHYSEIIVMLWMECHVCC